MGKFEYMMPDKLAVLYADDDHLCVTESSRGATKRALRCDQFCQLPFGDTIMNFLRMFPGAGSVPCTSLVIFMSFVADVKVCWNSEYKLFFLFFFLSVIWKHSVYAAFWLCFTASYETMLHETRIKISSDWQTNRNATVSTRHYECQQKPPGEAVDTMITSTPAADDEKSSAAWTKIRSVTHFSPV